MREDYRLGQRQAPRDPPADALAPDAMAVVDAFAAACERGDAPPPSEWLQRYPEHAALLADYAAAVSSEQSASIEDASTEQELSAGTLRAFDQITRGIRADGMQGPILRVAEAPAGYEVGTPGILALARLQGLDLEQLAQRLDLSQQLVLWLDRAAISRQEQPAALVQRLAQALGAHVDTIVRALEATGSATAEETTRIDDTPAATSVAEVIRRSQTLSAAQRDHWLTLLSGEDSGAAHDSEA